MVYNEIRGTKSHKPTQLQVPLFAIRQLNHLLTSTLLRKKLDTYQQQTTPAAKLAKAIKLLIFSELIGRLGDWDVKTREREMRMK
jgi:hypothetical protein